MTEEEALRVEKHRFLDMQIRFQKLLGGKKPISYFLYDFSHIKDGWDISITLGIERLFEIDKAKTASLALRAANDRLEKALKGEINDTNRTD